MQIVFYRVAPSPDLTWDLVENTRSLFTDSRPIALCPPDGVDITDLTSFFLEPTRLEYHRPAETFADRETGLTWLMRAGYFPWWWILRILCGKESTLLQACTALPSRFSRTLVAHLQQKPVSRKLADYFSQIDLVSGQQIWRTKVKDQDFRVRNYGARNVPKVIDRPG